MADPKTKTLAKLAKAKTGSANSKQGDSDRLALAQSSFNRRLASGGKPTPLRYTAAMQEALDAGDVDHYRAIEHAAILRTPVPKKGSASESSSGKPLSVEALAKKHLLLDSLREQNSDREDFKEVSIEGLRDMVREASGADLDDATVDKVLEKKIAGLSLAEKRETGGSSSEFHDLHVSDVARLVAEAKFEGAKANGDLDSAQLHIDDQRAALEEKFQKWAKKAREATHPGARDHAKQIMSEITEQQEALDADEEELFAISKKGVGAKGSGGDDGGSADPDELSAKARELSEKAAQSGSFDDHEEARSAHKKAEFAHRDAGNEQDAADHRKVALEHMDAADKINAAGGPADDDNPPEPTAHERKTLADLKAELKAAKDPAEREAIKAEHDELKQMVKDRVTGAKKLAGNGGATKALAGLQRAKNAKAGAVETGAKGGKFIRLPGGGKRYVK